MVLGLANGMIQGPTGMIGAVQQDTTQQTEDTTSVMTENNEVSTNSQYQLFSLSGQDLSELVGSEVDLLLKHIGNGHEDKALEAYKDLLGHFGMLYGYENVNINDNSPETQMIRNQLEAAIERKLNQGKSEEDYIELEDYIKENCSSVTEREWQQVQYMNSNIDTATEEDLLNIICDEQVEGHVNGLNEYGSGAIDVISPIEAWDWLVGDGQK